MFVAQFVEFERTESVKEFASGMTEGKLQT